MGQHVTDVGLALRGPKKELKKHAATIHCSNALSLLQRKISNALLYHAYKELMNKEEHEISVKQLCTLIGYQGHNHAAIKEALKELISTVIEWNLIDDVTGAENWTASSIIASVSLEGPLCYYAYSPRMKQLLHSPSMFGKIDLVIQSRFRSSYGLALYENCIRYRGLPHTKWFEMDLFKKLMGIPSGMYDVFRDFKRRVLDKAVDEVNTYSDLIIAPECVREGRKVVRLRFKLKEREKKTRLGRPKELSVEAKLSRDQLCKKLIESLGFSPTQAEELLGNYEMTFIQEKMSVIENSKPYQEGRVNNLVGYFLSALKHDYQPPKSAVSDVVNLHEVKHDLEVAQLKEDVEAIRVAYQAYREGVIAEALSSLSLQDHATFMAQFNDFAEPAINTVLELQRKMYTRDTVLESPQIKALLRRFALREIESLEVISLEEYVAQQDESWRQSWQKLKSLDPDHPLLRFSE